MDQDEEDLPGLEQPILEFPEDWSPLPLQDTPGDHEEQGGDGEGLEEAGEGEGGEGLEEAGEGEGGEEGQSEGEGSSGVDVAPEPVTPQAATSAARALQISLRALTELPRGEWAGAVQTACKQAKLDTHPDKGGNPEAFLFLEEQCRIVRQWLKEFEGKIKSLVSIFPEFDFCHCLKCARFYTKRKQCEVCMGLSPKKGHSGCGLQAGSFRVRRSYPNFWTYYLKLLAHGYTHENAKWQARECFELRKEEKNSGKVPEKARGAGRSPESTTDVGANQQKKETDCAWGGRYVWCEVKEGQEKPT